MERQNGFMPGRGKADKATQLVREGLPEKQTERLYMSVREMGDLLGLKKTDRYWLVHKQFFETRTVAGKMWVDVASFERWYANQVKYHKITGEEPGSELKAGSYSPRDISEMLGICEQGVYELIKKHQIETIMVDYWKRVPKEAFWRWYKSQSHYKTEEDREKEAALVAASVSMPEMARMLGTTRQKVYQILKDPRYQHFFDFIEIGGRRRITRESLQHFLDGQNDYRPAEEKIKEIREACLAEPEGSRRDEEKSHEQDSVETVKTVDHLDVEYLTLQEAAGLAGISRQSLCKYIDQGVIEGAEKCGGRVRIPKQEFGKWMIRRMLREEAADGVD